MAEALTNTAPYEPFKIIEVSDDTEAALDHAATVIRRALAKTRENQDGAEKALAAIGRISGLCRRAALERQAPQTRQQ